MKILITDDIITEDILETPLTDDYDWSTPLLETHVVNAIAKEGALPEPDWNY